ncbi:hypothetical protein BJF83_18510 [Nocardiopsis sp. CNR-923]|uniref:metal-dependent hydrolase n=1 Tax=Nocardiopsis sp. CNR-923 TaxID=1904965 RepID=UPI000967C38C|nr:metal-dependent hydrolase [Nocardiopsis sp. CNR-923]OLT27566.1 hypothetical protein BJF83_18510 [Nocardiopsis sp. CNR-923]
MLGVSHAATGLFVGVLTGAALGAHPSDVFVCGAVAAGAALLPDLDEPGSTAGRSLGPSSELCAVGLRRLSRAVYRATAGPCDALGPRSSVEGAPVPPGGHRHLTHTLPACAVFGLLGWGAAALGGWGLGAVVFAMAALGLGAVGRSLGGPRKTRLRLVGVLSVLAAATAVYLPGGAPWLVGAAVGAGTVTHVLGDWLTRSGVPLAWPVVVRGKRWWMFRSPVAFRTGDSWVETGIRWGCLAGAPAVVVLTRVG